jgi:hypothetical protein
MNNPEEFNIGDKVKINIRAFDWQRNGLTKNFINFIDKNADTIFTLKESQGGRKILWTFEENDIWLFWYGNLIKGE